MFSSDFPHPEGCERALEFAREALRGCEREDQEKFFSGNARKLFGIADVAFQPEP